MAAHGHGGELRVGYQLAATIGTWQLEPAPGGFAVQVTLSRRDSYWITQRPLRLLLDVGNLRWTWPEANMSGDTVYVSGPPQEGVVDVSTEPVRHA